MPITSWRWPEGGSGTTLQAAKRWTEGEVSVKTLVVTDDDREEQELVVIRLYTDRHWNHYVIAPVQGLVVAEGRADRERDSWLRAKRMLISRGFIA
jgi:hypothetical protein